MTALAFWVAAAALTYTYFGYPLLVAAWAALRGRAPVGRAEKPSVTVLVVAFDEAARIERRIENLLALDYPRDRLQIIVASDGSGDDTVARAERHAARGIEVVPFPSRRGKAAVLNDVVPRARGDIVVLGDSRQRFDSAALGELTRAFSDPAVGAVGGELLLDAEDARSIGEGVGLYWRYEKFIRTKESEIDSMVGATGAIYAIRRELFEPIPPDTVLDDVLIPMRVVRRGFRVWFERNALAYDRPSVTAEEERTRKVRTIAGNFQLLARERWLWSPVENRLWLQTLSHKGLRLLSPAFLAVAALTSVLLAARPFFATALVLQAAFYAAAALGWATRERPRPHFLVSTPYVFCLLNWTTIVAFARYLTRGQEVAWKKASSASGRS